MSDTKYCYPNSDILINKKDIRNKQQLFDAEVWYTTGRIYELQQNPIKRRFDFDHLKTVHKYIFQDLYSWAGKTRTIDIRKGNLFCPVQNISSYAESVFDGFAKDCFSNRHDPKRFIHAFTDHYTDMNALHPFREGNGRSQKEFARELCLYCGYEFDLTKTTHEQMLDASIWSFNKGNERLKAIFINTIAPITDHGALQERLKDKIVTLSKDDVPAKRRIRKSSYPSFMQNNYDNKQNGDDSPDFQ